MWYVAYGSNMSRRRFLAYLQGGRVDGSSTLERGAADPTPPRASARLLLDRRLRFVGVSRRWGGGVAVLEHRRQGGACTPARAWLIGFDQFTDVLAQENRWDEATAPRCPPLPDGPGSLVVAGEGLYGAVLVLGRAGDGRRVVTLTSPHPPENRAPNPPAPAYVRTIAAGIAETHGGDAAAHLAHLLGASREPTPTPGVRPHHERKGSNDPGDGVGHHLA
ncbi:MAG: histone deacetylase [Actinomyces sp.]|nr:MAG: histone deacetylase [Actinomyces sp.]